MKHLKFTLLSMRLLELTRNSEKLSNIKEEAGNTQLAHFEACILSHQNLPSKLCAWKR